MLPQLLFITNPQNSSQEEDRFLSDYLKSDFDVTVADPRAAIQILPKFTRCLIRNAWPSSLFVAEFIKMKKICDSRNIKVYNSFHRNGYIEDKTYLLELYQKGFPVIPTVASKKDLSLLPPCARYIIKPLDGCSSDGISTLAYWQLQQTDLENHLIQPEIDFQHEVSFYFIDNAFIYALVSAGKYQRWELKEYHPTDGEVNWAFRFILWNNLPWGLQRIDACRTKDGNLLLMEVESELPTLGLLILEKRTRDRVLESFKKSLLNHLT